MYLVRFNRHGTILRIVLCNTPEFWSFINLMEDVVKLPYKVYLDGSYYNSPFECYRFWMREEDRF